MIVSSTRIHRFVSFCMATLIIVAVAAAGEPDNGTRRLRCDVAKYEKENQGYSCYCTSSLKTICNSECETCHSKTKACWKTTIVYVWDAIQDYVQRSVTYEYTSPAKMKGKTVRFGRSKSIWGISCGVEINGRRCSCSEPSSGAGCLKIQRSFLHKEGGDYDSCSKKFNTVKNDPVIKSPLFEKKSRLVVGTCTQQRPKPTPKPPTRRPAPKPTPKPPTRRPPTSPSSGGSFWDGIFPPNPTKATPVPPSPTPVQPASDVGHCGKELDEVNKCERSSWAWFKCKLGEYCQRPRELVNCADYERAYCNIITPYRISDFACCPGKCLEEKEAVEDCFFKFRVNTMKNRCANPTEQKCTALMIGGVVDVNKVDSEDKTTSLIEPTGAPDEPDVSTSSPIEPTASPADIEEPTSFPVNTEPTSVPVDIEEPTPSPFEPSSFSRIEPTPFPIEIQAASSSNNAESSLPAVFETAASEKSPNVTNSGFLLLVRPTNILFSIPILATISLCIHCVSSV